ncbi:MAG TPA: metallophosphoesterase [Candidatus Nanoarchaeia archaeon]|nr:metallophosphoesterase [Candidatus Nanoarchaeia archaeon]
MDNLEIAPGIEIIGPSLWIKKPKILIINDLHLGMEESWQRKGILVPKFQIKEIIAILEDILTTVQPLKIIINGDLKDEFGTVLNQEWRDILALFDFLKQHCKEIIVVQGNHDPIIKPIALRREIKVVKEYKVEGLHIVHGDELVETKAKTIIIGHEHPAVTLREHGKWEKYKCFLQGKWKRKQLIAIPSFNPLVEGTNVLEGNMLSPFLEDISKFKIYVINKQEVFDFGKVKDLGCEKNLKTGAKI